MLFFSPFSLKQMERILNKASKTHKHRVEVSHVTSGIATFSPNFLFSFLNETYIDVWEEIVAVKWFQIYYESKNLFSSFHLFAGFQSPPGQPDRTLWYSQSQLDQVEEEQIFIFILFTTCIKLLDIILSSSFFVFTMKMCWTGIRVFFSCYSGYVK